ncbi:MAG: serine hydrolase domain-containing protein [Sphingomicrobium sp.]
MLITRRAFTGGALSAALSAGLARPALAQGSSALAGAIAAIRAHGEEHVRQFDLPGMTLGLTAPGGLATVLNFGFANRDSRAPIAPDTLFQIGSISKSMTATLIHQLAAEGRLRLTDRVSAILPSIPLPKGNAITVQHLLDHTAGLPDDAPVFGEAGLWVGYAPGEHWHYSNTGYEILGKIAEHVAGVDLALLLWKQIFTPLGMRRSRGAIVGGDRTLYAQGYEPADLSVPAARGVPLAPAAWVDVTFGAGSVASTAADMLLWLRSLANAASGRGGLGLSAEQAKAFTAHLVPSDSAAMSYGNGLMHVGAGGRSYLHHTGGMVAFSSSFHIDTASGVGAFASSSISAFAEYRPRLLTRFAVDALTDALAGRAVPTPPSPDVAIDNPALYIGDYSGPAGSFRVRSGHGALTILAGETESILQPWGEEIFRTTHPDYRHFSLKFDRKKGAVIGADWGPNAFAKAGASRPLPPSEPALAKLSGRFFNDSPWWGAAMVVERGGKLWLGTEVPLTRIGDNLWRAGEQAWSPERASFADYIDGRPQTFIYSGEKFLRHDI